MRTEKIAYQNKDITSKVLAENFKGKTFKVYGLDLPEIAKVLPTNIPAILANELRLDNLFELSDGTVAIVDYESEYKKEDKIKYLNYITGTANRYLNERKNCPLLRMIVIYTGDIKRRQGLDVYDIGAVKLNIEQAFLSELDSEEIFGRLQEKIEKNVPLTDEELMEFIILPLSYHRREEKEYKIKEIVEYAVQIKERKQQVFVLAGILTFTDKLIDNETAEKIRRTIEMTKVEKIFEREKQEALRQAEEAYEEKCHQMTKEHENEKRQVIIRMIKKNYPSEEIISLMPEYSSEEVENLRKLLANKD